MFDITFTNPSTNIFYLKQMYFQHFRVNHMPKHLQQDYCLLIKNTQKNDTNIPNHSLFQFKIIASCERCFLLFDCLCISEALSDRKIVSKQALLLTGVIIKRNLLSWSINKNNNNKNNNKNTQRLLPAMLKVQLRISEICMLINCSEKVFKQNFQTRLTKPK